MAGVGRMGSLAKKRVSSIYKGLGLWGKVRRGIALRGKGLWRFWAGNWHKTVEIREDSLKFILRRVRGAVSLHLQKRARLNFVGSE
jgi:hypothetical protein